MRLSLPRAGSSQLTAIVFQQRLAKQFLLQRRWSVSFRVEVGMWLRAPQRGGEFFRASLNKFALSRVRSLAQTRSSMISASQHTYRAERRNTSPMNLLVLILLSLLYSRPSKTDATLQPVSFHKDQIEQGNGTQEPLSNVTSDGGSLVDPWG